MNKIEGFLKKEEFLKTLNEHIDSFSGKNIFLIYLDIDDFFLINVNYGFEVGDLVLKDFANYLRKSFENFNILWGWLSNDQFILAVFDIDYLKFLNFIEKFLENIKKYKFKLNHLTIKLTASFGVSVYPFNGKSAEELLRTAAIALKSAKIEGKNTWKLFEPECETRVKNVEKIKKLLEYGINEGKIVPYIQPIFDANTEKIIGGEILLRILEKVVK